MTVATIQPVRPSLSGPETITHRLWTREEYDRMVEMGFFEGQHIQLIEGRIIEMPPQKVDHRVVIELLDRFLRTAFPSGHRICVQMPFRAAGGSDPEPDIAVVPGEPRDMNDHPSSATLVAEVSDSSLRLDREKARLYAASNVPEYWIVNLIDRRVEVQREPAESPSGWSYTRITLHAADETIAPLASPGAKVIVRDLLP